MFLFKKHLDRRTFLRGMGATVALPLLDAMIPASALLAAIRPTQRLAFVYFPHGAVMNEWMPAAASGNAQPFDSSRNCQARLAQGRPGRILEPLSPFANRLTIVSGVENRHAYGPVHAITPGTWLSGTNPASGIRPAFARGSSEGELRRGLAEAAFGRGGGHPATDRQNAGAIGHPPSPGFGGTGPATGSDSDGATIDQLAAEFLGPQSSGLGPRSGVLALAAEEPKKISSGIWEGQYDESLATTISFRRGRVAVPMESNPRAVFDAMFNRPQSACRGPQSACRGGSLDPPRSLDPPFQAPLKRRLYESAPTSVLDLVAADAARLRTRIGPADRVVLGDYLEAVRDAECRVEHAEAGACVTPQSHEEIEQRFIERLALMFDLTALAFRADITRVASLMMAAEASSMTYGHLGVPESFHLLSHHQNDPETLDQLVRIQAFHTRMFASFIRTLAALPNGDVSILDRTLILFGSNMSDSHAHDHFPLPLAMIGGGCGTPLGFRHVQLPNRTPMSNLLLTVLRRGGVPVDSMGDCSETQNLAIF